MPQLHFDIFLVVKNVYSDRRNKKIKRIYKYFWNKVNLISYAYREDKVKPRDIFGFGISGNFLDAYHNSIKYWNPI